MLAWALLRTLLKRLFRRREAGLVRFEQNYAADGLSAVSEGERAEMPDFGRCIACGRCDRGDRARIMASAGAYRGTMSLILAASRSMPDYGAAVLGFDHLSEEELAAKERICPTHVPMRAIARFVREKARNARVSLPAHHGQKRMPSSSSALTGGSADER